MPVSRRAAPAQGEERRPPQLRHNKMGLIDQPDYVRQWAIFHGGPRYVNDIGHIVNLLLAPGSERRQVEGIKRSMIADLYSREFEGSASARADAEIVLKNYWRSKIAPELAGALRTFYESKVTDATLRSPVMVARQGEKDVRHQTELETRPAELRKIYMHSPDNAGPVPTGNPDAPGKVGQQWGAGKIEQYSGAEVWLSYADRRPFVYRIGVDPFWRSNQFTAEVLRQVSEDARFAAGLFPAMVKLALFSAGMSSSIAMAVAVALAEEVMDEADRRKRGEKPRGAFDILTSAGKGALINVAVDRLLPGGRVNEGARSTKGADVDERAADVIRNEVREREDALVAEQLRKHGLQPVPGQRPSRDSGQVKVVSEGRPQVYQRGPQGWCRISRMVCMDKPGKELGAAEAEVAERSIDRARVFLPNDADPRLEQKLASVLERNPKIDEAALLDYVQYPRLSKYRKFASDEERLRVARSEAIEALAKRKPDDVNDYIKFVNADKVKEYRYRGSPKGQHEARTVAHDIGVSQGRTFAKKQWALIDSEAAIGRKFVNPVRGGSFDQGFDDIMFRGDPLKDHVYVVEYKGGGSRLAEGQMEADWVQYNIVRLCLAGGEAGKHWARLLAQAATEGRLRGVAFSTPLRNGIPGKTRTMRAPWEYKLKVKLPGGC